jgi:ankyrin repeat protein
MTALMWTSQSGHTAAAKALVGAGADLNLQDTWVSACGAGRLAVPLTSLL